MLVEIDASRLFEDDNVNWEYCKEHAPFAHAHACEFMFDLDQEDADRHEERVNRMKEYGCTEEFVTAYEGALALGAERVLFYAG